MGTNCYKLIEFSKLLCTYILVQLYHVYSLSTVSQLYCLYCACFRLMEFNTWQLMWQVFDTIFYKKISTHYAKNYFLLICSLWIGTPNIIFMKSLVIKKCSFWSYMHFRFRMLSWIINYVAAFMELKREVVQHTKYKLKAIIHTWRLYICWGTTFTSDKILWYNNWYFYGQDTLLK